MSSEVRLVASPRPLKGSRPSNRLRAEGRIPAVVYGHGTEPRAVSIVRRELRGVLSTSAGANALIDLSVDGQTLLTLVKDMQRDPVRNEVTHVDFVLVNRDEVVAVDVPIVLEGETTQVVAADGTVDQQLFTLHVTAKPGDIPDQLVVDTTELRIGDTIRVGDLTLPAGVETAVDPEEAVVLAQFSATLAEAEALDEAAAEEAAAESEASEQAEGAAAEETSSEG